MGIRVSYFSDLDTISYCDTSRVSSAGNTHTPFHYDRDKPNNPFERAVENIFQEVLDERRATINAKAKYREMKVESIKARYPQWSYEQIMDLKAQFQTFDLNQDGLIDFQELCAVLDELGDRSNSESRRQYFEELDEDGSGAVDFDEYLTLVHSVLSGNSSLNTIGQLCKNGTENAQRLRQLSIIQQIDYGLF